MKRQLAWKYIERLESVITGQDALIAQLCDRAAPLKQHQTCSASYVKGWNDALKQVRASLAQAREGD